MHYVYILKNRGKKASYIGYSDNLEQRIQEHKSAKDVELIYYEAYLSEKDARRRERKLKLYGSAWRGLRQRLVETLRPTA
jgi:putative endonuclease